MIQLTHYPIKIDRISQPFKAGKHKGIDLVDKRGTDAPVYAAADGTVLAAGTGALDWSYGKEVFIYHGSGKFYTNYGHLSKICVKAGKKVKAGDIIGYQGSTGNSTGNHLHFEVWTKRSFSNRVDPEPYLDDISKQPNFKVKTSGGRLRVRKTKGGTQIGSLKNKTEVRVIESGDRWSKIDKPMKGYVATKFIVKL